MKVILHNGWSDNDGNRWEPGPDPQEVPDAIAKAAIGRGQAEKYDPKKHAAAVRAERKVREADEEAGKLAESASVDPGPPSSAPDVNPEGDV